MQPLFINPMMLQIDRWPGVKQTSVDNTGQHWTTQARSKACQKRKKVAEAESQSSRKRWETIAKVFRPRIAVLTQWSGVLTQPFLE